jgi:hypothetical protein
MWMRWQPYLQMKIAPISARGIGPLLDFSTRFALTILMDEKRVSIYGASGQRTGHAAIPDDLRDETFRSQIHNDGV